MCTLMGACILRVFAIVNVQLLTPSLAARCRRCFDMMHYGHANALRQARALGARLVVGIHSDEQIIANKGPPLVPYVERLATLKAMRWVDEVIENAPYTPTDEWMRTLFEKHAIDYIAHGDDITLNEHGEDTYAAPKRAGKFLTLKRTEGVSTTDIIGRLLRRQTTHHRRESEDANAGDGRPALDLHETGFLATSRRITQFSKGKHPSPGQTVVLLTGAFDLFHIGHVDAIRAARAHGDYLIVGIHSDATVNRLRGEMFPIMNVHERALAVMALQDVDEVVIGCQWRITRDLIISLKVDIVLAGSVAEHANYDVDASAASAEYADAAAMGKLVNFASPNPMTSADIIARIAASRSKFEEKFARKALAEKKYNAGKAYVEEA